MDSDSFRRFESNIQACLESAQRYYRNRQLANVHRQEEYASLLVAEFDGANVLKETMDEVRRLLNEASREESRIIGTDVANELRSCQEKCQRFLADKDQSETSAVAAASSIKTANIDVEASDFSKVSLQPAKFPVFAGRLQQLHTVLNSCAHAKATAHDAVVALISLHEEILENIVSDGQEEEEEQEEQEEEKESLTHRRTSSHLSRTRQQQQQQQQQTQHYQQLLRDLLQHEFLQTERVRTHSQGVVSLWALMFTSANEDIAAAALAHKMSMDGGSCGSTDEDRLFLLKVGAGIGLFLWAGSEFFNNEVAETRVWNDPTFSIFMGFGDLLLLLWCWGICVHIWRLTHIDFVTCLGLKHTSLAHSSMPERVIYRSATNISLVFLTVFIGFNKLTRGAFHTDPTPLMLTTAHTLALCLMIYLVIRMLYPDYADKHQWWLMLYRVVCAPAYPVIFRDGYVGDLLTSLVRVFVPLAFSVAYVWGTLVNYVKSPSNNNNNNNAEATGVTTTFEHNFVYHSVILPFLTLFPLWIRLVQCLRRAAETGHRWPHYGNALKYTSAIAVISFGTFSPHIRSNSIWIGGFVFATLFQFAWDVCMDWGLLVWSTSADADTSVASCLWCVSLRKQRLVGPTYIYLIIAAVNLLLRFAWTLTLLPTDLSLKDNNGGLIYIFFEHLSPLIAAAEVVRRMMWGILRIEWEQLESLGPPDKELSLTFSRIKGTGSSSVSRSSLSSLDTDDTTGTPTKIKFEKMSIEGIDGTGLTPSFVGLHDASLHLLVPSSAVSFWRSCCGLDLRTDACKARLAESVLFAAVVVGVIAVAACRLV